MSIRPVSSAPLSPFERSAALAHAWAQMAAAHDNPTDTRQQSRVALSDPRKMPCAQALQPRDSLSVPAELPTKLQPQLTPAPPLATATALASAGPVPTPGSRSYLTPKGVFDVAPSRGEAETAADASSAADVYERELRPRLFRFGRTRVFSASQDTVLNHRPSDAPLQADAPAEVAPIGPSRLAASDAIARRALDTTLALLAKQKIRHFNSGLLLEAVKRKTSIADLDDVLEAQQQWLDLLGSGQERGELPRDPLALLWAEAQVQATRERILQEEDALAACLVQLRKFTGNPRIHARQIPKLRDHDAARAPPIANAVTFLGHLNSEQLRAGLEANPRVVALTHALALARSRIHSIETALAGDPNPTELLAKNVRAFVFDQRVNDILAPRAESGFESSDPGPDDFGHAREIDRPSDISAATAPPQSNASSTNPAETANAACRNSTSPLDAQVAECKSLLEQQTAWFARYKEGIANDLQSRALALASQGPGSFWNRAELLKVTLIVAGQQYRQAQGIEMSAAPSPAQVHETTQARVHYLETRRAYNAAAGDHLGAINRLVYLLGGFADTQGEAFTAFDAEFSAHYG